MMYDDIDQELIQHMAVPESVRAIWDAEFPLSLVEDDYARRIVAFQMKRLTDFDVPADEDELTDEFDVAFTEPETTVEELLEAYRAVRR